MSGTDVIISVTSGVVEGFCAPSWAPLREEFVRNFTARGEVGASLCVTHKDEVVVDLWGGTATPKTAASWTRDTMSVVFSATKGATALCAHLLAARGALDLDAKVSRYWPEFARNGKEAATVRMLLDHSVGVPGFREPIKDGGYADWDYMVRRLEEERPFWEPGTRCGYHLRNIGWTVGEVVRRVSGESLGAFFRKEIAEPLGLDFWIGLPETLEPRVSHIIPHHPEPDEPLPDFHKAVMNDPNADSSRALANNGGLFPTRWVEESGCYAADTRIAHAAELGGSGGVTHARGLAGLYRGLANGGGKLFSEDDVWRMSQVSMASHLDPILLMPTRFALGFMKSMDNRHRRLGHIESVLMGDRAFGHVGAGGSIGFADPDCALSLGYTMNRQGPGILLNDRGQSLVDTAYRILGYRSNISGVWAR